MLPGCGKAGGVYIHIIGAETLKAGQPIDLGWMPAFLIAVGCRSLLAISRSGRSRRPARRRAALLLLAVPIFARASPDLRRHHGRPVRHHLGRDRLADAGTLKRRGLTNTVSGLPNLYALRRAGHERDRPLIVARVVNYPQIVSTLSLANERSLIEQIVSPAEGRIGSLDRLPGRRRAYSPGRCRPGPRSAIMSRRFTPCSAARPRSTGKPFDIAISFGVEIGSGRSLANRLGSALVAADEATAEGLRWKYHDPERLKDAEWRLSLLSQLDDAIDHGQVWVAYQPQLDLGPTGCAAPKRWPAGPTRKRARSARANSSPPPSRTTGSRS